MVLMRMLSGLWTGVQRSAALSYPYRSSSGGCRIEMHSSPLLVDVRVERDGALEGQLRRPEGVVFRKFEVSAEEAACKHESQPGGIWEGRWTRLGHRPP